MKDVFIIAASRSPMGSYGGSLSSLTAVQLGSAVISDILSKSEIDPALIESVTMGNVISANVGQAPARQASMAAGLPNTVCATTVNKVCASGLKAASIVHNDIVVGNIQVGIAGGMESMSNVPHYIPKARFGLGYGNSQIIDGLAHDGLTDVYNQTSMGVSGDKTAEKYQISREAQDDYAERSFKNAATAWANGSFAEETVSISIPQKKGDATLVSEDETYKKVNFEKMRLLKPAFSANGTVTAANASPLNDGASAVLLADADFVKKNAIKPLARIVSYAEAEHDPLFFTTAPVFAAQKALIKANLSIADIDFFEVNEAFAVVPLAFIQMLKVELSKVNIYGGAISLGHPLGSSGSRILVSLIHILKTKKAKYGMAAICNGGGGASAMIIENIA